MKANPKFHHWQTDEKRFGLTFERYDDAKAFDKGIKSAVADLVDGMNALLLMSQYDSELTNTYSVNIYFYWYHHDHRIWTLISTCISYWKNFFVDETFRISLCSCCLSLMLFSANFDYNKWKFLRLLKRCGHCYKNECFTFKDSCSCYISSKVFPN